MNNFTTFVTFLGIIGIPSIFTMTMWCIKKCKQFTQQLVVLAEAQQAQMRNQLISQYKFYMAQYHEQGWVDIEDIDDWENQYQKYHLLGANGVLDKKREQLLSLPNSGVKSA